MCEQGYQYHEFLPELVHGQSSGSKRARPRGCVGFVFSFLLLGTLAKMPFRDDDDVDMPLQHAPPARQKRKIVEELPAPSLAGEKRLQVSTRQQSSASAQCAALQPDAVAMVEQVPASNRKPVGFIHPALAAERRSRSGPSGEKAEVPSPDVGGPIPDGWIQCEKGGEAIHGIAAIKTPLSASFTAKLPEESRW